MPVTGLPDRKLHHLCFGCRAWFHPHEGVLDWPRPTGPLSWLRIRTARAVDDDTQMRFFCLGCHAKLTAKPNSALIQTVFALIVAVVLAIGAFVAWRQGLLDSLLDGLLR